MGERTVDVLVVRWYERAARSPGVVERWLEAAGRLFPEAAPRRFGDSEPLRGKGTLHQAYAKADPLLFLAGSPPVYHAALTTRQRGVAVHSLHAVTDPADDRVRAFALALTHPEMLYASASVARGQTLDGGTLYGPGQTREEPYLAPRGDWLGLPPAPPVWCWFGPAYARLVRKHITAEQAAGGLLFTGGPWVPAPLRARLDEPDPARRRARRIPGSPLRFW